MTEPKYDSNNPFHGVALTTSEDLDAALLHADQTAAYALARYLHWSRHVQRQTAREEQEAHHRASEALAVAHAECERLREALKESEIARLKLEIRAETLTRVNRTLAEMK